MSVYIRVKALVSHGPYVTGRHASTQGDISACKTKLQHLGGPLLAECSIGQTLPRVHVSSWVMGQIKTRSISLLVMKCLVLSLIPERINFEVPPKKVSIVN